MVMAELLQARGWSNEPSHGQVHVVRAAEEYCEDAIDAQDLDQRYRTVPLGPRTTRTTGSASRLMPIPAGSTMSNNTTSP